MQQTTLIHEIDAIESCAVQNHMKFHNSTDWLGLVLQQHLSTYWTFFGGVWVLKTNNSFIKMLIYDHVIFVICVWKISVLYLTALNVQRGIINASVCYGIWIRKLFVFTGPTLFDIQSWHSYWCHFLILKSPWVWTWCRLPQQKNSLLDEKKPT